MVIIEIVILLFLGFVTGILSGLLGIGGGILFIPILYFLFDAQGLPHNLLFLSVVSTSLFAAAFTSTSSAVNHHFRNNIKHKEAFFLGIGALVSAVSIPVLLKGINSEFIKYFLAFILSLVAAQLWIEQRTGDFRRLKLKKPYLIPAGILIAAIASTGGIGGGVFFVPVLYYLFDVSFKESVGTAVVGVALTTIAASSSYLLLYHNISDGFIGHVYLRAGLSLGFGAIFGSFIGAKLVFKISSSVIKKIFSLFLIAVIIKILTTN